MEVIFVQEKGTFLTHPAIAKAATLARNEVASFTEICSRKTTCIWKSGMFSKSRIYIVECWLISASNIVQQLYCLLTSRKKEIAKEDH